MIFHMSVGYKGDGIHPPKRKQPSRVFVSSPHPVMSVRANVHGEPHQCTSSRRMAWARVDGTEGRLPARPSYRRYYPPL